MNSGIVKRSVVLNDHKTERIVGRTVLARIEINRRRAEGRAWQSYLEGRCRKAARQSLVRAAAVRAGEVSPRGC